MKLPYYEQQTCWTCGPAVMRMVLEPLGIFKTEKQLIQLLRTNKKGGTTNMALVQLVDKYKLNYVVFRNGTMSVLKRFLKQHYRIIISYYYEAHKTGHYAVLKKITKKNIYLLDPWCGPDHQYKLSYFHKIWREEKERGWFIGIKK